jgi:putative hemolysin
VSMRDGGQTATALYQQMIQTNLAPLEYRVAPKNPIALTASSNNVPITGVPPLMKGYMRAGAWVCGAPHWDPDFNTADFFMMLQLSSLDQRYARHYLASNEG